MSFTILIIDDEKEMCISLAEILEADGYTTRFCTAASNAFDIINTMPIDLIITDINMAHFTGIDFLKKIKGERPDLPIIMITGYPSIESAVTSMKYGALNFYTKPLPIFRLLSEIKQLAGTRKQHLTSRETIIGRDEKIRRILFEIDKVAPTTVPILITGESGTGKELIAAAVHARSNRAGHPYIKVNCASIPDSLLESELFGHEKGAFTDAKKRHIGIFERGDRGTIFLDEIGDMSMKTQPRILRVLQDGEITRLGSVKPFLTDTRVISATNKDLSREIEKGLFRQDLFYRLSTVTIALPPLRERRGDIELLMEHFLYSYNETYSKAITGYSSEVRNILTAHSWPGNIRELKNCIERAVIFADSTMIDLEHLPSQYHDLQSRPICEDSYQELYDSLNKQVIMDALSKTNGVKQKAADLLNIHRKTLYNRMKKLGIT